MCDNIEAVKMSTAADELVLLERVFLRIGAAETDDQLQNVVSKFLPPVLLKLSSPQDGVRKKVMELLIHINRRLKSRPLIQLPVEALLVQYQDPAAGSFVTNFTIIYIKLGYPRLPLEKQAELVASVLNALDGKPQSHRDSLLFLLMPVLGSVVPKDPQKRLSVFGLNDRPQVTKQLSDFMLDMLLLPYGATVQQKEQPSSSLPDRIPMGLSEYGFRRVTGENPLKPEELEQTKLGIVKFLSHGAIADTDVLVHLVVAAADTRFNVAHAADVELARITRDIDWSNPSVTTPLYHLFLGSQAFNRKLAADNKPELLRSPAGTRIRLKIMQYLAKAQGPAILFPGCVQVLFDALYGTHTNLRLKTMALQSFTWKILPSNLTSMASVAGVVMSALLKLLAGDELSLRGLAYTAIGKLVERAPELVSKDLSLLQRLFDGLSQEDAPTRMSLYHALMSMVEAFNSGLEDNNREIMQALLSKYLESEEAMARLAAVRYLRTVFPGDHAPSRYLLLLVSCDTNLDVHDAAKEGLYAGILPPFIEMVNVVTEKVGSRLQGYSHPFSVNVYKKVVMFLVMCAVKGAQGDMTLEEYMLPRPAKWTPLVGKYLCQLQGDIAGKKAANDYITFVEQLAVAEVSIISVNALLDAVGSAPELLAGKFSQKLAWLKSWLLSPVVKQREAAAQLYGTVVAHSLEDAEFDDTIVDLINGVKGKTLETQHGCVLALAHALERRITLIKKKGTTDKIATWPAYRSGVDAILSFLDHPNILLIGAACSSIGELARCFALPLPPGSMDTTGKLDVVKKLQSIANNPKISTKVKEDAVMALGCLCVGESFPHSREVIESLLDMDKSMDLEVHLTVGEALVCCMLGSSSPQARDAWRVPEEEFEASGSTCRCEDVDWLLLHLINEMAPSLRPSTKQASCLWLLALLKQCGHQPPVQCHLQGFQKTFMHMLGENNDIIQDAASKGLSIVYESSDKEAQNQLMTELLDQLTQGRRSVVQVTGDTKLFEEGQLGKTPSGGSLSTYKELCDLVNDLNQPELIYKFMNLANHSALWHSKKGAAFGFSAIAESAGEQLSKYLPKIVPRLYRYKYDPTPKIQKSMTSIWTTLVREPIKTIEQFFPEILNDLLTNLTSPQWRVRTSCCLGLLGLMHGGYNKNLHDIIEEVPRMWKQLFRVMDDIHEGTRQAATNTTNFLSQVTVRSCAANLGKIAELNIRTVLPILLEYGICNNVAEVRAISLQCMSQLVGYAGKLLQPHLADLIPALLEATSELEMRGLSQLSVGFGADQERQEQIDSLRASAAKSHYTTETVTKCVPYIDKSDLEKLVPRVQELMRNSVGLGTRVACAHLVVLLAQHLKLDLQPYTGKLLATLVNGLLDRNPVIRKNYASTIGHLISTAKDSSVEKLLDKLQTWYFEKEDENVRFALALTFQSMARHNQERLKEYSSVALPLVFLGMHATKSPGSSAEVWEDVWQEMTTGTESGIRQNLFAICCVLIAALHSLSWTMKAQAARAVSTVASKAGTSVDSTTCHEFASFLVNGLSGRTWNGKENLLQAVASVCTGCKDVIKPEDSAAVVEAVLRECRKDQPMYRQFALQAIGDILFSLKLNHFNDVYTIVQDIVSKEHSPEKNEDSNNTMGENGEQQESKNRLCEIAYETLGKSWPADEKTQFWYREELLEECVSCLPKSTRGVQVAVISALRSYCDRLTLLEPSAQLSHREQQSLNKIVTLLKTALSYTLGIAKHTRLKKESLNVLYLLIKKLQEAHQDAVVATLTEDFRTHLEEASKDNAPEIMSRVADIKGLLNKS